MFESLWSPLGMSNHKILWESCKN